MKVTRGPGGGGGGGIRVPWCPPGPGTMRVLAGGERGHGGLGCAAEGGGGGRSIAGPAVGGGGG